jgi:hypothetical protein
MATKRDGRANPRPWTKQDERELKAHSRSKTPVKKNLGSYEAHTRRTSAKGARPRFAIRSSPVTGFAPAKAARNGKGIGW